MPAPTRWQTGELTNLPHSIRMNENDYGFLVLLAKEENEDVSKTVRELVGLGRTMLTIEKYKSGEASIEKATRIAGVSISSMLDIMKDSLDFDTLMIKAECPSQVCST